MPATATDRLAGITTSVAVKPPCVAVTNFTTVLSGLYTLGSHTLEEYDRVLVNSQTDQTENGIYNASSSNWTRALDFDGQRDVVNGTIVIVRNSTINGALYEVVATDPIIIGSSSIAFVLHDDPAIKYSQTVAEGIAGVTPLNTSYPPMYVDRYATNVTPGTTDMSSAFNTAIAVAVINGGVVRYGATAIYAVTNPINVTTAGSPAAKGVTISADVGTGMTAFSAPQIIANHSKVVFDCTGSSSIIFERVSIGTGAIVPKAAFLFARNITGGTAAFNCLINCCVLGSFSAACIYNYGSEDFHVIGGNFQNSYQSGQSAVMVITGTNIRGLVSYFTTIYNSTISCIDHKVFGGEWYCNSNNAAADVFYLESCDSVKIYGPWCYCAVPGVGNGRSIVYVDCTNAGANYISLRDITGEQNIQLQNYGVLFSSASVSRFCVGWTIDGCLLPNALVAIRADTNVTLENCSIRGNLLPAGTVGISIPGTILNSMVDFGVEFGIISIGTSTRNRLSGDSSKLSITTRTNDNWIDTGTQNKSFNPGITTGANGWTAVGAITQRGKIEANGARLHISIVVSAATTIACTNGATITGLPFITSDVGSLMVTDTTAHTVIGAAQVNGTTITLPAITATADNIIITGTIFVA